MRAVEVASALQAPGWTSEEASAVVWALELAQEFAASEGLEVEMERALTALEVRA
jgi:hypothetical protein